MHFCPGKSVFMSQNVAEITLWQLHGVASTSTTSSTQRDLSRCHDVVQRIDPKQVADRLGPSWAIRAGDQTDTVTYSDYFHSLFMAFPLNDHLIQDENIREWMKIKNHRPEKEALRSITCMYMTLLTPLFFFHCICDDLYLMTGHRSVMVSHPPK